MKVVILGTTGDAMDVEMNFFFTFWGLNLLKKKHKLKVNGMPFPFKGLAARMFRKKLKDYGYEDPIEMLREGVKEGKIKLYPCSMTYEMMGFKKEDLLDFVEEPVGAATFFEISADADNIIHM